MLLFCSCFVYGVNFIMNIKNNKRSKVTRSKFKDAMINLMETNHISEISITALCNKAGLNRSTFYSHFENQMDVLREIENDVYEQLKAYLPYYEPDNYKQALVMSLEFIKNNNEVVKVLLSDNGNQSFKSMIAELSLCTNKDVYDKNSAFKYHRIFNINGFIGVIIYWLNNGMNESVEDMSDLILNFGNLEVF